MDKLTPFLWFDSQAQQAAAFYVSLFPQSEIIFSSPFITAFRLMGTQYQAMNGGPSHKLTEAFSIMVSCEDQAETDHYWAALIADGGEEGRCGWCTDRFGLSWQVIPKRMVELMTNPASGAAATQAMLKMGKIDIAAMEAACSDS